MRPDADGRDTWDITTSVGSTALFVAAARALESQKQDPLAVDPYAQVFCRAAGGQWAELLTEGGAPDSKLKSDFGKHFVSFQGARTKYFDAFFAGAADAGVRQIVLLAAGLDSRAYRLTWPEGTKVYELDQPRVLAFKRETLAAHGDAPRADRREIAVDLRDDWAGALKAAGFDASQPSAWLAEGLLIYLPASAQEQLFIGIDQLAAPGSWVAVEEGRPMPAAVWEARKAEEQAIDDGEHFFTLIYNEQIAPAEQWFGSRGWAAKESPLDSYLREVGRPIPADEPEAGYIAASGSLVSAVKH